MRIFVKKEIDLESVLAHQIKAGDTITGIGVVDTVKMGGVLDVDRKLYSWSVVRQILRRGGMVHEIKEID